MQNETMIYGYARVSTAAQDESGQVTQLKAAGCEKVFRGKITGTTADRPQLGKLMKALARGDVVITPAVDLIDGPVSPRLVVSNSLFGDLQGLVIRHCADLLTPSPLRAEPDRSRRASGCGRHGGAATRGSRRGRRTAREVPTVRYVFCDTRTAEEKNTSQPASTTARSSSSNS